MLGFKSFADKTSLDFQDGVTAIVGPNGCGKSNVADAIRWVLGEQSAKALRGGAMHDVIFSGTDRRKPLQMAEVSLTLDDVTEHQLQAAGLELGYTEVTITRRVYRDGGSEYYINKTQCRLKDIQQLFMGTGIGRTSYSIMAQGNITQILSSKPDDRRIIFEEAAGITRFKAQKKEALRKIEHTEQNLIRVEDLIKEVKRRIGTLQRQAGKAKKYKELMSALKSLDTQLSRHKLDIYENEKSTIEDEVQDHANIRNEKESEYQSKDSEVDELRSEFSDLESQVSEVRQKLTALKAELDQNEERIQFHEKRIVEIDEQNQQAANESVEADERLKAARSELERASSGFEETQTQLEKDRQILQTKNEALHEVEKVFHGIQERTNEFQSKAFSTAQDLAQLGNQINQFDLQKQGDIARLEKLNAESKQFEKELSHIQSDLESVQQETTRLEGEVQQQTEKLDSIKNSIQSSSNQLDEISESILEKQKEKSEYASRLDVLNEIDSKAGEGDDGVQSVLKGFSKDIVGTLVDSIAVETQYVAAVESIIKKHFNTIIIEDASKLDEIDELINRDDLTSVDIALLGDSNNPVDLPQELNKLDKLSSFIQCKKPIEKLIERLCGHYFIIHSIKEGLKFVNGETSGFGFVTLEGDVLYPEQIIHLAGKNAESLSSADSVLARKNEISELSQKLDVCSQKLDELHKEKEKIQIHNKELKEELEQVSQSLRLVEMELAGKQSQNNSLQSLLKNTQDKKEVSHFEIERLKESQSSESSERDDMEKKKQELESEADSIRNQLAGFNIESEEVREKRDHAANQLTEAKVQVASMEQIMRGFLNQVEPLKQRILELENLMVQRSKDQAAFAEKRQESLETIEKAKLDISKLENEVESTMVDIQHVEEEKQLVSEKIKIHDTELKEIREFINKIQEEITKLEVRLSQKSMLIDALIERVQDKYQVDLKEVETECITISISENGPPDIHTMTPDEMEAAGASQDWDQIEEQVKLLQDEVDSMGPVNLVAIEEYEDTEERYDFLNNQHQDLLQAKEKLMEAVNRINTETREMFLATFTRIRANFQNTFEEIFGGGKADLILVDEEDVLESGIDIVARPPGKKLQSISLLSGGEQTMTAVSLLFAIYQVKPSPFCVLDELDAPLDESNINRFLKILKRFVSQSQFLIITHSKRTISMADILYGVTMQERGVSKMISVRFKDADGKSKEKVPDFDGVLSGAVA